MADVSTCPPLTRESVQAAHNVIKPHIHRTQVVTSRTMDEIVSAPQTAEALEGTAWAGKTPAKPKLRLYFKCENLQRIGAFKARGAFHAIERLKLEPGWAEGGGKEKGVCTHSSGTLDDGKCWTRAENERAQLSDERKCWTTGNVGREMLDKSKCWARAEVKEGHRADDPPRN
jgi:hypothetical protein